MLAAVELDEINVWTLLGASGAGLVQKEEGVKRICEKKNDVQESEKMPGRKKMLL